jgi:hypothetical protein
MSHDSVIDEIHRVRREISEEFGGDVHAFFSFIRDRATKRTNVVTLDPVRPDSTDTDAATIHRSD